MRPIQIRPTASSLKVLTFGDLLDLELPPREDLLTPWMREGESALLYAPTGIGKSMLALSIALAVAGGGEFLGWLAPAPRRVLFVDGEMAVDDIRDRAAHLARTVEGLDVPEARRNLSLLARQHQGPDVTFPDLAEEEGRESLLRQIRTARADLVILDNLSTLATIEDENAASSFNDATKFLLQLKQSGTACILVHHSGKSGETYRGSSKLAATFNVIVGLRKLEGAVGMQGAAFELVWDKLRARPDQSIRNRRVWLADGDDGPRWESEVSDNERAAMLVEAVRTGMHRTGRDLARALSVSPPTITRLKQFAIARGYITEAEWNEQLQGGGGSVWEGSEDY